MMTTSTMKEQVQELILDVIPDISLSDLQAEEDIFSLGLDSINAMALLSNLQDTFDIQLDTDDINFENFQNVDSLVAMVQAKAN